MTPTVRRRPTSLRRAAVLALACLGAAGTAAAQTTPAAEVTLRGGVALSPSYIGSDDYDLAPDAALRFNYVRLPGGLQFGSIGGVARQGFGLRGSLRYIGSRTAADDAELEGLDDVDRALELGFGLGYEAPRWRAFGDVRYGFVGHNAWAGELGADALFHPVDDLIVNVGPRAGFGSGRFMRTYFGVTAEEAAAAPGLTEYTPSGGIASVGVEVGARYAFSERWGVEGAATFDRLVDDAADSPIVGLGSRDQYGVRIGITRTISLGF